MCLAAASSASGPGEREGPSPSFTLSVAPEQLYACIDGGADMLDPAILSVGSVSGFSNEVTLFFNPALPAGFSGDITPAMVTPADPAANASVDLTVAGGTPLGNHQIIVEGTAEGAGPVGVEIHVQVSDMSPPVPALLTPADGATEVPPQPSMTWTASAQATEYLIQIATDPAFNDLVISATTSVNAFNPSFDLPTSTQLYWRVRAANRCGESALSEVSTFATQALVGDCGPGQSPIVYFLDNMENGANGWTHNAIPPNPDWEMMDFGFNSPTHAWHAQDVAFVTDQRLVSPAVVLPAGITQPTLQFYTRYNLEEGDEAGSCFDGGILEYSSDSGLNWTQVDNDRMVNDPYTGPVSTTFQNPLGGLQAWCDVRQWNRTVVDLTRLDGLTLRFRFRLGTDNSFAAGDWRLDDVRIQSCQPLGTEFLFGDGFENNGG